MRDFMVGGAQLVLHTWKNNDGVLYFTYCCWNDRKPGYFALSLRRSSRLQVPGHHRLPIQQLVPRRRLEGPVPQSRGSSCRCDLSLTSASRSAACSVHFSPASTWRVTLLLLRARPQPRRVRTWCPESLSTWTALTAPTSSPSPRPCWPTSRRGRSLSSPGVSSVTAGVRFRMFSVLFVSLSTFSEWAVHSDIKAFRRLTVCKTSACFCFIWRRPPASELHTFNVAVHQFDLFILN